jgi:hypothetical protein
MRRSNSYGDRMIRVAAAALVFGAVDQFLGTTHVLVHTGAWTTTVSNMSALWLILPFLAGCSQATPRRAVGAGAIATLAAFVGYFALTLSPLEGVSLAHAVRGAAPLVHGQAIWLAGGALTAPAFGFLGYRWRAQRAWSSALAFSLALALEPVAWVAAGLETRFADPRPAWAGEVVAGLCALAAFAWLRSRRPAPAR